ncbi:hypothetical protein GOC19_16085 [Sinorhizobium meliloti]|uniref:hypothetical protein n=1 Tax=Rhizobium meliloti TaxID=382 RepID=UPI000FDB358E|nr:hypothetical protein [Sinorhizobium meliloti]MDX0057952.1 hypothetical protein [Sinorhizobium meliloti]RVL02488.1 hypothetical protein CN152_09835 [Sinorhizobium meliloti]RVN44125.1 hypothetical protein CN113_21010 [Sinorhizobium meliloti]
MTVKLASLKANLEREAAGDWIEYPDWPGVAFCVKSLHSPSYVTARDLMLQRQARKNKGKAPPADVIAVEAGKIYSQHILLGWRGLDVEYSADVALQVLTDPAYRQVVAAIEWCAQQVAQTDIEFVEEATKNSDRPSAGA